jgi:hypothetical protein
MPLTGRYPRGGPRPTSSRGERLVYEALSRTLPAGWYAWHSLRLHTARDGEGEEDFVIVVATPEELAADPRLRAPG